MKKSTKTTLFCAVFALATAGVAYIASNKISFSLNSADELHHVGNHYLGRSATNEEAGCKEYWVCCDCHDILLSSGSGNVWADAGVASDDTLAYVQSNTNDIRYAAPYTIPLVSLSDAVIYQEDSATIIENSIGIGKAVFTIDTVNSWIGAGIESISFKITFDKKNNYESVVQSKNGEYIIDTTGEKTFEVPLHKDNAISIWSQDGDYGKNFKLSVTDFQLGKAVKSIALSDYTDTIKFGKPYEYDGKVTVTYDDDTTNEVTNYSVDYSNLDRFTIGDSSIKVTYCGKEATAPINIVASDELKVLMIGNSFSIDTMQWTYKICASMGITDVKIANLAIGGCSLQTHWNNIQNDNGSYEYYNYNSGWSCTSTTYKISKALQDYDWDFISFQQVSDNSGVVSSYTPYIENIAGYLRNNCKNKDVNLAWNMTWAYQSDSTHAAFPNYGKNQMTMYNAICSAVQTKAAPVVDIVIPNGTTIQNARTSYIGDHLTRDGFHLNENYGRYFAGLTFVSKLTGNDPSLCDYFPTGCSEGHHKVGIESAKNAIAHPYEVTNSAILTEPQPEDEMFLLEGVNYFEGYYWNIQEGYVLTPWNKFCASPLFTKDDLPEGSIIKVKDGYQIRIERFTYLDKRPSEGRFANATGYVYITSDTWENFKYLGFNISRVSGDGALSVSDATNAISIYTEEEHSTFQNINYLSLTGVATWESGNPEIQVGRFGAYKSNTADIFTSSAKAQLPAWIDANGNSASGNSEYAFGSPKLGIAGRCFLFRFANKDNGTSFTIKKGVTFENNNRKYQFDRDYEIKKIDGKWVINEVHSLSVVDLFTWSSGNLEIKLKYNDADTLKFPGEVSSKTISTLPLWLEITNSTLQNFVYGFESCNLAQNQSENILIRVNNPTTNGVKVKVKGNVQFEHNGFQFIFDKDYEVEKADGKWVNNNEEVFTISVTKCTTWTTGNPEITVNFPEGVSKFSQELTVTAIPSWEKLTNCTFVNIVYKFPGPIGGQTPSECILFRVDGKTNGSVITISGNEPFKNNGVKYQFDRTYTLTYDGTTWTLA